MAKRKKNRKTLPDDGATYRPRLDVEQQAANRHKASADHYKQYFACFTENTAQIREKLWIQVAERRAAAKLAKRRWDPPKRTKTLEAHISTDSDVDAGGVDSEVSGQEVFASPSLVRADSIPFGLLDTMNESSSDASLAAVAILLEEQLTSSSMSIMAEAPNIVARPDPPTPDERIVVEALASMALFQVEPPLDKERADSILSLAGKLSSLSDSSNGGRVLDGGETGGRCTSVVQRGGSNKSVITWWEHREDHNLSHFQESCRNEQEFYNYYNT
ncbi:hypothetical protein C8J57DRAFT_1259582 [Mycena rebaudengoi]|nr:hypothetical protein C8J57DRAFT_1259582 [Mycena rebaudengoi]